VNVRSHISTIRGIGYRFPDLLGVVHHGVVYTGGKGKIAEHGGPDPQDRNVPLVGAGKGMAPQGLRPPGRDPDRAHEVGDARLDPNYLQAVEIDHTSVLPVN
jgi:hypothetical protein